MPNRIIRKGGVVYRDYAGDVDRRLRKMARASTEAASRVVERELRAEVAVDTGESRRSIGRERVSDTTVIVGAETEQARILEHAPTRERGWFTRAWNSVREPASEAAEAAAKREARRP